MRNKVNNCLIKFKKNQTSATYRNFARFSCPVDCRPSMRLESVITSNLRSGAKHKASPKH